MSGLNAVIIADDLTGALDSIAPFAALGLTCLAALSLADLPAAIALGPQVLAVNLGSRELPTDEARALATRAAQALQRAAGPGTIWLKKIDSRLKGAVAAETEAVAAVLRVGQVLLCPAIPELGRVVRRGLLEGVGVVQPIPVRQALPDGLTAEAPDAESDADLDRLVAGAGTDCLFVGARGLAAALARSLRAGRAPIPAQLPPGPLGFAIGSRDPITLAQVTLLQASGGPDRVAAPDGEVPPPRVLGPVLVQATPGAGSSPVAVSQRFATGLQPHLAGLTTLVVTGGETVAALLHAAGVGLLRITGEVLPGLPLCHAEGHAGFPALVTKSGGFGAPDTLLRLWQAARSQEGQPCR
jgi:D-threonate/D-erythronate kinase